MDGRVDFALDRSRLLAPNLAGPGTLVPMTSYGNDLNRAAVTELTRTATPATMTSLAQYQSRFLPSTMSMHSPGASFALMGGFLGGAAPADNLKSLMPDLQQFWTPHADGYPRFVINNTPYTPFTPFLPTAAETLPSLLPPGPASTSAPGPAHCHRIYELQKDAFLASVAASQAGLYGILPNGHPYLQRAPSPLQQPQVSALPIGLVKQEPRDVVGSSCQGISSERSSAKSSERRLLASRPGGGAECNRREPPRDSPLASAHGLSGSGASGRSQCVQRPLGSKSQKKTVDRKEVVKLSSSDHLSGKDRRPEAAVLKQAEKRARDPALCKWPAVAGSGAVVKSDVSRPSDRSGSLTSPRGQTTKPLNGASQHKPSCGKEHQRLACSKEQPKSLFCSKETPAVAENKIIATPQKTPSTRSEGVSVHCCAGKPDSAGQEGHSKRSLSPWALGEKREEHPLSSSSPASLHSNARSEKTRTRDRGDNLKDGGGNSASMEQRSHPPCTAPRSDVRAKGAASPIMSTCSHSSKSTSSFAAVNSNTSVAGTDTVNSAAAPVVPTLVTVTSSSCDVSTVTSVPVTSGGTESVFTRSQPVACTGAALTATSPVQVKCKSVTTQVATSALPYYHPHYTKPEGGQEGSGGIKRVHATTTFVPEVGTFKGPLIRTMSKGCPESKVVKSEQPKTASCRLEETQGAKPPDSGRKSSQGVREVPTDPTEEEQEDGSEDDSSDVSVQLSQKSSSQEECENGDLLDESHHRRMEQSEEGASNLVDGNACSPGRSSVPFSGSRSPSFGFQSSEENPEVALDFSISKRSKEFADVSKCQEKATDRSPSSVSNRKGLKCVSSRGLSSVGSCVPKVCGPVHRTKQREATAASLQMTHGPQASSRQGALVYPPHSSLMEIENAVLNLSKSVTLKKPATTRAASSVKLSAIANLNQPASAEQSHHVTGSRLSQLVSKEKRCGSAPPHSFLSGSVCTQRSEEEQQEEEDEEAGESYLCSEEKDSTEHVASNIPVGIAVAQQRADGGRVDTRLGVNREEHGLKASEGAESSRQLTHEFSEREEFLRMGRSYRKLFERLLRYSMQQKSVLAGAGKPIPNTGLPPNLVVTGGDNSLPDDLRVRPLTNQWLAAGHGITASPWLPPNPFALHPAIPTSTAAFDPNHPAGVPIPGGFKLAQDPLTGHLLIIPGGDLLDQNSLWSAFQSGANSQSLAAAFPSLAVPLTQHAPVSAATSVPTTADSDEHAQAEESDDISQSVDTSSVCEDEHSDGLQSPEQASQLAMFSKDKPTAVTTAVSVNNNMVTDSGQKGDGVNLNSSFVTADLTAQSLALHAAAAAAAAGIATPQFPFVFNPALLPLSSGLPVAEALGIKTETASVQSRGCSPIIMSPAPSEVVEETLAPAPDNYKQVTTACASVQTCSDDLDLDLSPTVRRKSISCREQGIQTSLGDHLQPLSVICGSSDFHLPHTETAPLGALAAAALVAEGGDVDRLARGCRDIRSHGVSYNPFTDPQILQAADGLELLSTLAEKRPKCSSAPLVDPKTVFPSPSDSFKSDTPLPCPELEEASSLGEGERSGGTTPRGNRPRDLSPKWGPVSRKDMVQLSTGAESKASSGLTNMDAIELDMRLRLAQLQRQYREKQRELANLQPKKDKDDGVKRGRGRPRKRQFLSGKKFHDESSNSSGGKTVKEGSVKRRRPAEELVDRVFRKLPPAKVGQLKMKAISFKHKRRTGHSFSSSYIDATKVSGKKKDKHRRDTGNLFSNLESSFGNSALKKKVKRESEIPATVTSAVPYTPTTITPVTLESGLGLLAKFATSALSSTSSTTFSGAKRKSDEWEGGLGCDTHSFGTSPGHSPLNKRRESDTDNSDTANGTCIKKRKPGRPRKCDPNKNTGFTETIWARQTGLLQLSDVAQGKTWVSKAEEAASIATTTTITTSASSSTSTASTTSTSSATNKLASSVAQAPLVPLLLDEWSLRRSERIFLSDTSPLPSPNLQPAKDCAVAKVPAPKDSRSNSTGQSRPAGGGGRGRPPGTGYKQRQRASSLNVEKPRQRSDSGEAGVEGRVKVKTKVTETVTGSLKVKDSGTVPASGAVKVKTKDTETVTGSLKVKDSGTVLASGAVKVKIKDTETVTGSLKVKDSGTVSASGTVKVKSPMKEERKDKDRAKVQKARSLQELTQKVKRKYNKNLCKKSTSAHEDLRKRTAREEKPKAAVEEGRIAAVQVESDSSSEADNLPLSSLRERPVTPEPRSCIIRQEELQEGLQVLFFRDSLFYEGLVQAIQPPDIYGVVVTGQRGTRPHICSREEILKDAIMAVAVGSKRYVAEGTRVCAYWSQQFRCLYPGTVAKTSPNPHVESSVNVEFDDGDSGRIPLAHIRLLPPDFPLVKEKPDPLLYPTKRRRRTLSEEEMMRSPDDRNSVSGSVSGRRKWRASTMEDDNSDDGSVFETASLKSNFSGKSSSRSRACKEDVTIKTRREKMAAKDTRSLSNLKPGPLKVSKSTARKSDGNASQSDEEDSEDEECSSDDEDESSSSWDDQSEKKAGSCRSSKSPKDRPGQNWKRDPKKKKDDRTGGSSWRSSWRWDGRSTKRPGMRGKAKKEFYKSIARGTDHLNLGDSAVFVSTGRDHCPYIGRIESLWESWGGQMMVKVKWFYHPEETKGCKQLAHPKGALFESPHSDENDVQTISHKCQVLSFKDYSRRSAEAARKGQTLDSNTYYLAGYYDPTIGFMKFQADVQ